MLKDSLYKITSATHQEGSIEATFEINATHQIFKGHFPGQPVLPGACMLQIVKEVLEDALVRKLQLKKADNLKFIQLIDPQLNKIINLKLFYRSMDYNSIYVNGSFISAEAMAFKFQAAFIELISS